MRDQEIHEALDQHWAASDSGDFGTEHDIYQEDAVLDYPQSRERIIGRHNIQITRSLQPNKKRFVVHRIIGSGDLWVSKFTLTYDNQPFYTVQWIPHRGSGLMSSAKYVDRDAAGLRPVSAAKGILSGYSYGTESSRRFAVSG